MRAKIEQLKTYLQKIKANDYELLDAETYSCHARIEDLVQEIDNELKKLKDAIQNNEMWKIVGTDRYEQEGATKLAKILLKE